MRKWARSAKDSRAEMGVGTLIIFIAMVLVAAVAASVLINVVDNLQEQATQVADDTQDYFNTQLDIFNVNAVDTDDDGTYDKLVIGVQVAFSSGPVDTTGIWVIVDNQYYYYNSYLEETGDVTEDEDMDRYLYDFYWQNPSDLEYDNGDVYLQEGQTAVIILGGDNIGFEQEQGDEITINIYVEDGLPTGVLRYTAPIIYS